jgi:esterase/lipase superfamily enzyme
MLRRRLADTPRKEIYLYIHGIGNSLASSSLTVAELWHFMGRPGVPVVFSWPAKGQYGYDRESGEFSVYHLKESIRRLSRMPEVEALHLIGHSRGTDVLSTAIRELFIESRGAREDARLKYKIRNIVLAAPDLDFGVIVQRFSAENFSWYVGRSTVYASRADVAIRASSWLFGSRRRVGCVRPEDLSPVIRERFALIGKKIAFVHANVRSGLLGHSYFYRSPAVSSDLIRVLAEDRDPGAENGRPLKRIDVSYWELEDDYLLGH